MAYAKIGATNLSNVIFCRIRIERLFSCAHRDGYIRFECGFGNIAAKIDAAWNITCDFIAFETIEYLDQLNSPLIERFAKTGTKKCVDDDIRFKRFVGDFYTDRLRTCKLQFCHL